MIEVRGADLAVADSVMESVEWQMSNFMPAKGESGQRCQERRFHAAIAEAVAEVRQQAEAAMRERLQAAENALQAILYEAERGNGGWVHLKRVIGVKARAAIRGIDAGEGCSRIAISEGASATVGAP